LVVPGKMCVLYTLYSFVVLLFLCNDI
jgi:hypothetical protein